MRIVLLTITFIYILINYKLKIKSILEYFNNNLLTLHLKVNKNTNYLNRKIYFSLNNKDMVKYGLNYFKNYGY
jgi:hypothetical protein